MTLSTITRENWQSLCVHANMHVCMHTRMHAHTHARTHVHACVRACECVRACMDACVRACVYLGELVILILRVQALTRLAALCP